MITTFRSFKTAVSIAAASFLAAGAGIAGAGAAPPATPTYVESVHAGRAAVYQQLPENSLEQVSTSDRITAVAGGNVAPTEIWTALEHGEKVECLDCIPDVATLLYDGNRKTREISAWWLRRRVFGVFGPGEVYSQTLDTLQKDSSEARRAYAAEALGEFLLVDGVAPVASAAVNDTSAMVRASSVRALERLNTEGPAAELATAIADAAPEVRLAALGAATRINVFSRVDAVVARLSDESPDVRRRAADVLGTLRASDAVVGLIALSKPENESDPRVRIAAVSALGKIADPSAHGAVADAESDPDALVQSVARIALRRL
jgi:HEAT repeat protein